MNGKWFLSLLVVALGASLLTAQISNEQRAKRSDEILRKVRQMDIYNQVLPLLLTEKQVNALLPVIERARTEVRKTEATEYDMLLKLEPGLDAALKEAAEQRKVPSVETLKSASDTFKAMNIRRQMVAGENVDAVIAVLEKELTAGQKKTLVGSLRPSLFDPTLDPQKLDDATKMRFFVQTILLDPEAYDVLLKLSRPAAATSN